jgi:hypothetical protein
LFRKTLAICWAATANFGAPILLAWLLAGALYNFSHRAPVPVQAFQSTGYGPITLRIRLPGPHSGVAEPLVACGVPGNASLIFIRVLDGGKAVLGVDFWGVVSFDGNAFTIPEKGVPIEVTCFLPAFFPNEGDRYWGSLSSSVQKQRRSEFMVKVDGVERLKGRIEYDQPLHPPVYIGENTVGSSMATGHFTGDVLGVSQAN